MTKMNSPVKLLLGCMAITTTVPALAEQPPVDPVSYVTAMRCSALYSLFAATSKSRPKENEFHTGIAARWLTLAMARDGKKGARAQEEHQPMLNLLIQRVNAMSDDQAGLKGFLEKGADTCEEFQEAAGAEFAEAE